MVGAGTGLLAGGLAQAEKRLPLLPPAAAQAAPAPSAPAPAAPAPQATAASADAPAAPTPTYTTKGAIGSLYQRIKSQTGAPTSHEQAVAGGVRQSFAKGTIYWSSATGA